MSSDLEFTGERFVPGIAGEIALEHWHRYVFARRFAAGRRVLDVACGEGYGSALLAEVAREVRGVDIDAQTVVHAANRYATLPNVRFEQGSAAALSLPDASVDVVVSFETIEHLPRADQPRMLAEIARVLRPDGVLIMSAPNPVEYSDARNYRNPFHVHEPDRAELEALIAVSLPAQRWFRQRRYFGSALWSELPGEGAEAWEGDRVGASAAQPPAAMYFVVVAARSPVTLPANVPMLSLFSDRGEAELARLDHEAREVLRLDALLRDRDSAVERLGAERNELARQRNTLEEERDEATGQLASARDAVVAYRAECDRLDRAVTAQERIIAYRQSARWWVSLPWLRFRLWWQRFRTL